MPPIQRSRWLVVHYMRKSLSRCYSPWRLYLLLIVKEKWKTYLNSPFQRRQIDMEVALTRVVMLATHSHSYNHFGGGVIFVYANLVYHKLHFVFKKMLFFVEDTARFLNIVRLDIFLLFKPFKFCLETLILKPVLHATWFSMLVRLFMSVFTDMSPKSPISHNDKRKLFSKSAKIYLGNKWFDIGLICSPIISSLIEYLNNLFQGKP